MHPDANAAELAADIELIKRWRDGDEKGARALVERHAQALSRFAASQGVRDEVDELVQDTFVRAFAAIDTFRADSSFRTWLFTIERRLILDRRRAFRRRKDDSEVDERDAATAYDSLDTLVAEETAQRIRDAIARLSPMQRDVFTLRLTEGLSYKEIAEVLGSTEGAARVHYHNAVQAVRELLDDDAKL
ncbi:MAG TPA: RNA polymerase sigma factor [Gemmatimonadaceae bacterium]|nr:RNA polymerase sigma factor [Gemmatimonadaceae bacterium]